MEYEDEKRGGGGGRELGGGGEGRELGGGGRKGTRKRRRDEEN